MYGLTQAGLLSQELLEKRLWKRRILPKQTFSWTIETPMAFYPIHPRRQRFRSQVRRQGTCPPSHVCPKQQLHHLPRFERFQLRRNHTRLVLRRYKSTPLNVRIHCRGSHLIFTQNPHQAPRPTLPQRHSQVRQKDKIRQGSR